MSKSQQSQSERIKAASRKRREQQKAETRQAIVGAASELFLQHGYDNFSLRQVAEQIGYSPGTIYLYFDDKDDLLFTIADEGFGDFGARLQAAVDSTPDPRLQLEAMYRAYVDFGLENPVHYRLMFIERPDFMLRDSVETGHSWLNTFYILQHTVERALAAGAIAPGEPEAISDVIWASVHGIVALGIRMPYISRERIDRAVEENIKLLHRGMEPE